MMLVLLPERPGADAELEVVVAPQVAGPVAAERLERGEGAAAGPAHEQAIPWRSRMAARGRGHPTPFRSPILQLKIILAVEPLIPSEGPRIGENIFGYTIVDIFSSSCRGHHKNPPSEPYVLEVNRDLSFYNFRTKQVHEFTARLLDIHDKMMLINNKEDIRLILHRSDYMLDSEINSLLQIENSRSYILPPTLQLSVVPSGCY
ncbi:Glutathione synthetase, chloroplastic [Zea mays]|uniref:Glutathione synthetase, chloroplastic n=1 Tax=Zea mays TaxID=4577 RepID=A0A3L6EMR7_MAIZE|nr:Glutathione synthetase, chloroplastic [Zea mays]